MDWARRLLLTPAGRRTIAAVYFAVGIVTVTVYWIMRSPLYAIVLGLIIAFGAFWVRWCLRRPAS